MPNPIPQPTAINAVNTPHIASKGLDRTQSATQQLAIQNTSTTRSNDGMRPRNWIA